MSEDAFDELDKNKSAVGGGGDYAPWWNEENFDVEEGDELIGVCVEKHVYTDPGGDEHPVATIRSMGRGSLDEGTEVSTPTRTGIEPFAGDLELGDLALIEYEGEIKANTGRTMHAYQASKLTQDEWSQTDQADDITSVWQASDHYSGGVEAADTSDSDDAGELEEAKDFATDVLAMNDGEISREEFDEYITDIKDYDVDTDVVIAETDGIEEDGDDVVEA